MTRPSKPSPRSCKTSARLSTRPKNSPSKLARTHPQYPSPTPPNSQPRNAYALQSSHQTPPTQTPPLHPHHSTASPRASVKSKKQHSTPHPHLPSHPAQATPHTAPPSQTQQASISPTTPPCRSPFPPPHPTPPAPARSQTCKPAPLISRLRRLPPPSTPCTSRTCT